jgi:hypothetical protein
MRSLNSFSARRVVLLLAVCHGLVFQASVASAATFAPTPEERLAQGDGAPDPRLDGSSPLPAAEVDESGRRYYAVDDMRYSADAVETDSAFDARTWPGGVLYYVFESTVTASRRQAWRQAAAEWAAVAPVSFVEGVGNGDYVLVKNSTTTNSSFVGLQGGAQEMNIVNWGSRFIIAHEIGHALGLIHEHSRTDRDAYVRILMQNITAGEEGNFNIERGSVAYGGYDFESVMHYGRATFSRNGQNTIEPTPPYSEFLDTMGHVSYLSRLDATGMAERYGGYFQPAANDNFGARQTLPWTRGTVTCNTVGATRELGEPDHAGQPGGASVWYSWTAAGTGTVIIDTVGTQFDTLLHVYTGELGSGLTSVVSNDDISHPTNLASRVTFSATAGRTYVIAVDGWGGGSGPLRLNWQAPGVSSLNSKADFDGDGDGDFVWQNTQTGERVIWFLRNGRYESGIYLPTIAREWRIASAADFNGDGQADFVWQNINTGERVIWFLRNGQYTSGIFLQTIAREWEIASAGDFNNDGHADFVWQNTQTGERVMWFLRNGQYQSGIYLQTIAPEWRIAGAADFNADGYSDFVWQNTNTGERVMWFLRDGQFQSGLHMQTIQPEWRIAAAADFNQDGNADLAWQNINTGERVMWFLRNGIYQSGIYLPTIDRAWDIAAH